MALCTLLGVEPVAFAQQPPLCIPGTPLCARANGTGGVEVGGTVQGQANPNGARVDASGNANANANANANGGGTVNGNGNGSGNGSGNGGGNANGTTGGNGTGGGGRNYGGNGEGGGGYSRTHSSEPIRFGAGVAFCGTLKAGVFSGIKAGPCFAISFRTEPLIFELETQLLFGGVRHSTDWVFPMSFVIPLTTQQSLYEGLQLRVGGSPIGVTFAKSSNGGNYLRFGLHAGLSYEYDLGPAASFRVFDIRAFLDFATRREVDRRNDFLDFGGQLSTGIVF